MRWPVKHFLLCTFWSWCIFQCHLNFGIDLLFGWIIPWKISSEEKLTTKCNVHKTRIHTFRITYLTEVTINLKESSCSVHVVMLVKFVITWNFSKIYWTYLMMRFVQVFCILWPINVLFSPLWIKYKFSLNNQKV